MIGKNFSIGGRTYEVVAVSVDGTAVQAMERNAGWRGVALQRSRTAWVRHRPKGEVDARIERAFDQLEMAYGAVDVDRLIHAATEAGERGAPQKRDVRRQNVLRALRRMLAGSDPVFALEGHVLQRRNVCNVV